MIRRVVIRPEAEADLLDAMSWYKAQREGLEDGFFLAFDASLSKIRRTPKVFPIVHGDIRRALLRRFPYGIYYFLEGEAAVVIAVFHAKRDPKRWQQRR